WIWSALLAANLSGLAFGAERANFDGLLEKLPPLQRHIGKDTGTDSKQAAELYERFLREKLSGSWFATVLPDDPGSYAIHRRFSSWGRFMDFLQEHDAIVEVWVSGEAEPGRSRRLEASEISRMRRERYEKPTMLTITYREAGDGRVVTNRVE